MTEKYEIVNLQNKNGYETDSLNFYCPQAGCPNVICCADIICSCIGICSCPPDNKCAPNPDHNCGLWSNVVEY